MAIQSINFNQIDKLSRRIDKILKKKQLAPPTKVLFCDHPTQSNFTNSQTLWSRDIQFLNCRIALEKITDNTFLTIYSKPRYCDRGSIPDLLCLPWILSSCGVSNFLFINAAEKLNNRLRLAEPVLISEQLNSSNIEPFASCRQFWPKIETDRDSLYHQSLLSDFLNSSNENTTLPQLVSEAFITGIQNSNRLENKLFKNLGVDILSRSGIIENSFLHGIGRQAFSLAIINSEAGQKTSEEDYHDAFHFGLRKVIPMISQWLQN